MHSSISTLDQSPVGLNITHLQKSFPSAGGNLRVLDDLCLSFSQGEFVTILGPNGCGKSTLLNMIANLTNPDTGQITFMQRSIDTVRAGFVFQDSSGSLFPWLTAKDNICFPLKLEGTPKREAVRRTLDLYYKFKCSFDLEAYPYQLSGGQQQVVSILRSLIIDPELLLLDEPFSSLDSEAQTVMRDKLLEIWQLQHITTLFVSHAVDEAIYLSQKIVVLSDKPARVLDILNNSMSYPRCPGCLESATSLQLQLDICKAFARGHTSLPPKQRIEASQCRASTRLGYV